MPASRDVYELFCFMSKVQESVSDHFRQTSAAQRKTAVS